MTAVGGVRCIDSVLEPAELSAMVEEIHRFPAYTPIGLGTYHTVARKGYLPRTPEQDRIMRRPSRRAGRPRVTYAPGLGFRADAGNRYLETGGRFGRIDDPLIKARFKYFRETLVDDGVVFAAGITPFLRSPVLAQAGADLYGLPVVQPYNVYVNLLLPAQELGPHYDVSEFRGANTTFLPPWLLPVMSGSGLFEPWRVKVATAILYPGPGPGGGRFVCYPDGPAGRPVTYEARANRAVVLDSDTVFHGVDRTAGDNPAIAKITNRSWLEPHGTTWTLCRNRTDGTNQTLATYPVADVRISISWKARCFADEADRRRFANHEDDLTFERIMGDLLAELRRRGRLPDGPHGLSEEEIGLLMIDEFLEFPEPEPAEPGA